MPTTMKQLLLTLSISCLGMNLWAQHQVAISTNPTKASIAIKDAEGKTLTLDKTPVKVTVQPGETYSYQLRHPNCKPDSGMICFDENLVDTTLTMQPYVATIEWKVEPQDASYTLLDRRTKKVVDKGDAFGQTMIQGSRYRLTIKAKDYRTFRKDYKWQGDTTITYRQELQYCPTRTIIAVNAAMAAEQSVALGITVGYGGVHGVYTRWLTTLTGKADGKDFYRETLASSLYNPYSDVQANYWSGVIGYQYYTPWKLYVQLGMGYGTEQFNWLSEEDGKRHSYEPDTRKGMIVDLGVGYPIGRCYVGAAVQTPADMDPEIFFKPLTGMISFGIIL